MYEAAKITVTAGKPSKRLYTKGYGGFPVWGALEQQEKVGEEAVQHGATSCP